MLSCTLKQNKTKKTQLALNNFFFPVLALLIFIYTVCGSKIVSLIYATLKYLYLIIYITIYNLIYNVHINILIFALKYFASKEHFRSAFGFFYFSFIVNYPPWKIW